MPLVAVDPYFSIWSPADRLTDAATVHWTGRPHPLVSLVRVDGEAFRLMGVSPSDIAALPQTSVDVLPTRTVYKFANASVRVTLTFVTPALPSDLDLLSRPVTYIAWDVVSADAKPHSVQLYLDVGADVAVNTTDQVVQLEYPSVSGLAVARVGTVEQPVLARKGDDVRIDWGYAYLAAPAGGTGGTARSYPAEAAAVCAAALRPTGQFRRRRWGSQSLPHPSPRVATPWPPPGMWDKSLSRPCRATPCSRTMTSNRSAISRTT